MVQRSDNSCRAISSLPKWRTWLLASVGGPLLALCCIIPAVAASAATEAPSDAHPEFLRCSFFAVVLLSAFGLCRTSIKMTAACKDWPLMRWGVALMITFGGAVVFLL